MYDNTNYSNEYKVSLLKNQTITAGASSQTFSFFSTESDTVPLNKNILTYRDEVIVAIKPTGNNMPANSEIAISYYSNNLGLIGTGTTTLGAITADAYSITTYYNDFSKTADYFTLSIELQENDEYSVSIDCIVKKKIDESSGGGIEEAPIDGSQYARKDASWEVVVAGATAHNDTTNRDIAGNHAALIPSSDSTTAIQIRKADGTTPVVNYDTTNSRMGIGTIIPINPLEVRGGFANGRTITAGETLTYTGQPIIVYYKVSDQKYYKAQANAIATCGTNMLCVVSTINQDATGVAYRQIASTGTFTAGTQYLSPTVAGAVTATEPTTPGHFVVPLGNADTTSEFTFMRPQFSIGL